MVSPIPHALLLIVTALCRISYVSAIGGADSEGYPYVFANATGSGFKIVGSDRAEDVPLEVYSNLTNLETGEIFLRDMTGTFSDINETVPSFSFPINENHSSQKESVFGFPFDMSHMQVEIATLMTPTETGTYIFQLDYTGLSGAIVIFKEAYSCGGLDDSMFLDFMKKLVAADVSSGPDYTSQVTKTLMMDAGQTYTISFIYSNVFNETYHNTQQYASMNFSMTLPSGETVTDFSDYAKNQYDVSAPIVCLYYDTTSITVTGTNTYMNTLIETTTITPTGTALGTAAVPIVEEVHYVILPSGYTMTDSPSSSSYESSSSQVSSSIESSSIPPSSSSSSQSSTSEVYSLSLTLSTAQSSSSYSLSTVSVLSGSSSSSSSSLSEYTLSSIATSVTSFPDTSATSRSSSASSAVVPPVSSFEPTRISSFSEYSRSSSDTVHTSYSDLESSASESATTSHAFISQSLSSVRNSNIISSNVSESSRVQSSSFMITGSTKSSGIVSHSNDIISSSMDGVSRSPAKSSTGPFESSSLTSSTDRHSNPSSINDEPSSITSSLSIQSIVQPFNNTTTPGNQVTSQSLTTKTITNTQGVVITTVIPCDSRTYANSVSTTEVIESRKVVPSAISASEESSSKTVTTQVFNGAGNGQVQVFQSNSASDGSSSDLGKHSTISKSTALSKEGTGVAQLGATTAILSVTEKASPTVILYSPETGNDARHNYVGFVVTLCSLLSFFIWF